MKRLFLCLTLLSSLAALYIGGHLGRSLWRYWSYSLEVPIDVEKWKVVPSGRSRYAIAIDFSYQYDNQEFRNSRSFEQPLYLNEFAAKKGIGQYELEGWKTWINPKSPNMCCLQKFFPFKTLFHFCLCMGITLYFAVIGHFFPRYTQASE